MVVILFFNHNIPKDQYWALGPLSKINRALMKNIINAQSVCQIIPRVPCLCMRIGYCYKLIIQSWFHLLRVQLILCIDQVFATGDKMHLHRSVYNLARYKFIASTLEAQILLSSLVRIILYLPWSSRVWTKTGLGGGKRCCKAEGMCPLPHVVWKPSPLWAFLCVSTSLDLTFDAPFRYMMSNPSFQL